VPTLTQIGYAMGMLLLAPLGDVLPRRRLILAKAVLLVMALVAAGFSLGSDGWSLPVSPLACSAASGRISCPSRRNGPRMNKEAVPSAV